MPFEWHRDESIEGGVEEKMMLKLELFLIGELFLLLY